MAEKIGVYFDESALEGCLDAAQLSEEVKKKWGDLCPVVKSHARLASQDGKAMIQADIDAGTIDSVCICGTSPRLDWDFFQFGAQVLVGRVNLREQCVWAYQGPNGEHPSKDEVTPELLFKMAKDYVNMGVVQIQKANVPVPEDIEVSKKVLVLGGGWTGLNAAVDVAKAGYPVTLVEKEAVLGGYAAKMYKTIPLSFPYTTSGSVGIQDKIELVKSNEMITVLTKSSLESLSGMPGKFTATIKTPEGTQELEVGAVIGATGWKAQDTKYLAPFGYGKFKNVITSQQFEEMAKAGQIVRPSDGKAPGSVLFLLSFGEKLEAFAVAEAKAKEAAAQSEDKKVEGEEDDKRKFEPVKTYKHLPFSSEIATLTALKQAGYVREFLPNSLAYIMYEHMMVPGINELYYKAAQNDPGILLSKGRFESIRDDGDDDMAVRFADTLLGPEIDLKSDLVVVPTAMVPTSALEPIMKFKYRQGQSFPDLELFAGFADSNYICFPYETRRTGVYMAGTVRQPMTLSTAATDASGAALKAVQCLESVNRGMAVHPRSGDFSFPKFNFVRCTQCKRCTEECPFGALDEDEKGNPMPNIGRCRRCGTCMGACPERVISFDDYNIDQIGSMVKQIEVPDEIDKGGPRFLILACENDAYPALDMAALRGRRWSPYVRIIPVRCLGSVNAIWIADAMSKGNDGCLLLGCKYGDDYQCHFVKGSELCNRRMDNIGETLGKLGIETERVQQMQIAIDEYDQLPEMIDEFVDRITKLGPNPFKGY
ncbi:MAG: hydrogenase iron-sulfur subunit [Deltaproteobacteria bacterium]|nr:hydrogenase iron-sulfur subunit [Deltaproteobacteria bacterium]